MSFLSFSSFLHKACFSAFQKQVDKLVVLFMLLAFQLQKLAEKQEQIVLSLSLNSHLGTDLAAPEGVALTKLDGGTPLEHHLSVVLSLRACLFQLFGSFQAVEARS
jgi:hypothetical protein